MEGGGGGGGGGEIGTCPNHHAQSLGNGDDHSWSCQIMMLISGEWG